MKTKAGTTLVELIIYMGLLSILMLILTQLFTNIVQTRLETEASSNVQQDGDFIVSRFMYDIAQSSSIVSPSSLGVCTPPGCTLQLTINGVTNTYTLSSGMLQLTNNNGTNTLNGYGTTISNLTFTRVGNGVSAQTTDSIIVNFTLSSTTTRGQGKEVKSYEVAVAPR